MSVELRPLGVRCNIGCEYCYQQPQRDAGNARRAYDLDAMKAAVVAEGGPFTLFGGEPLLLPVHDLEELWAWGLERFGGNSVQTNGTLIRDVHVGLFRRYRVQVGISIDGPGALNDVRRNGTQARTRRATARTEAAIERLCREGMTPSLIVTLHRGNAAAEHLPLLHDWFRRLDGLGVTSVRLHLLEVDDPAVAERHLLSPAENVAALLGLAGLEAELPRLRFDLFAELRNMLAGNDRHVTCVWRACDPYTTPAVRGVEGTGRRSNCGRTNKEGIDFVKAADTGFERQLALYRTTQKAGGCRGCRFFLQCKGQCPGTAAGGDWRNRSDQCAEWFALLEHVEGGMLARGERPLSRSPLRPWLEQAALRVWEAGQNATLADLLAAAPAPADVVPADPEPAPAEGRLPFRLPPFRRLMWTSDEARAVWYPRMLAIGRAVPSAVPAWLRGTVRDLGVLTVAPWQLLALRSVAARHGLAVEALTEQADIPPRTGPLFCTVAVGRPEAVRAARQAWDGHGVDAVRLAAGVPGCCVDAAAADRRAGWRDRPWPAAVAGEGHVLTAPAVPGTNVLHRRLGLRAVQHDPCRPDCRPSGRDGDAFLGALRDSGHAEEAGWLTELLSWPVDWSARHGIAELRCPVFKLAHDTDATAGTLRARLTSEHYPAEGATGLAFPYPGPRRTLPLVASGRP